MKFAIPAASTAIVLAACGAAEAEQSAQVEPGDAQACYTNSSGQAVYLESRMNDGERGGFMFQPGSSVCIHRADPLEVWVRQEEGGAEICSGTIEPGHTLSLTRQDGSIQCKFERAEAEEPVRETQASFEGSMSWQNKTGGDLYFEALLRNDRTDGRIIAPDAFFFTSNLKVLEFRVRHDAEGEVICTGAVEPGHLYQLKSIDGPGQCTWEVSEH